MTRKRKEYNYYTVLGAKYALPLIEDGNKTKEQILMESTILFAKNGYAALSMRELAEAIGIKPASLYNYFKSKKALWNAVLDHTVDLYYLYFDRMDEGLNRAGSIEEALEIIFAEPKKMQNIFTCYAFSLIMAEQHHDRRAGRYFCGTFLDFSINFLKKHFDRLVEASGARAFDTETAALVIMHGSLTAINFKIHEDLGDNPVGYQKMLSKLQSLVLHMSKCGCLPPPVPELYDNSEEPAGPEAEPGN